MNAHFQRRGHRAQARRGILARVLGFIFGYHESGQLWSPDRSIIPGGFGLQDSRYDDPPQERRESMRKARYFEVNGGIVNRIADVWEIYTVGAKGLRILPKSSDRTWNQAAKRAFRAWAKHPDLSSTQSFESFQSQVSRRWLIDGETFVLKARSDGPRPELRVQLIESHRVCTPGHLAPQEGEAIWDGIEYDRHGRPIAYWVEENGKHTRRSADQIIHIAEPSRPGQRPFTFFDPVLNTLHDLDDLQKLEMLVAKDAAEKANVLMNETGEISGETMRKERFGFRTKDTLGNDKIEDRVAQFRKVLGGRTIALKRDEKLEQFKSDRPNVTTREYWDYLTSLVCAGVGVSKLLVFPWSMQGTVVRADLDIQNTFFRARSGVLQSAFLEIYLWVVDWEANFNRALANRPGDWQEATVLGPRGVGVDVGRNSSAMLAELEAGARTYEMTYGDLGEDWEEQFEQRAREEAFLDRVSAEHNISPARLRKSITEALKLQMEDETEKQNQEDEEELPAIAA